MALTIGEIVGYARLDDSGMRSGAQSAEQTFERLARELRADLEKMEREARQAGKGIGDGIAEGAKQGADKGGSGMAEGMLGRFQGAGPPMVTAALAIAAAVGAVLVKGITDAMEFEQATAKMNAALGATGPEAAKYGEVAGRLYAEGYGESMQDVTKAIQDVVRNMDDMRDASSEDLQAVGQRAMDVASIMDEDVGKVTAAVSQMMRNDLASSAEEAFDIIAVGAQQGADKSGDLLDTFNEYSTKFRDIGLSGQQAMGLMSQGLKAGARDADTVADSLKEFAIRAIDGSKTTKEGFAAIGLSAKDMATKFSEGGPAAAAALDTVLDRLRAMKDPVERDAAAVALFGTKAEDLGDSLYALDPSTAVASLGQISGAAQTAGDTLHDTAGAKLEKFQRSLQMGLVDFMGGTVIPAIERFVEIVKMSGIIEAWTGIRDKALELWGAITETFREWASENSEEVAAFKENFSRYFREMGKLVEEVIGIIIFLWENGGGDLVKSALKNLGDLYGIVASGFEQIRNIIEFFTALAKGDWEGAGEALKRIASTFLDQIRALCDIGMRQVLAIFGLNWDEIKVTVRQKIDGAIQYCREMPGKVKGAFGDLANLLPESGRSLIRGFVRGIEEYAQKAKDAASAVMRKVRDVFPFSPAKTGPFAGRGWVLYSGQSIATAMAAGIRERASAVRTAALGLQEQAANALGGLTPGGGQLGFAGAGAGAGGSNRAPVHIENYHPPRDASAADVAHGIDWLARSRGGY